MGTVLENIPPTHRLGKQLRLEQLNKRPKFQRGYLPQTDGPWSVAPVSYTHLDVYKRQVCTSLSGSLLASAYSDLCGLKVEGEGRERQNKILQQR